MIIEKLRHNKKVICYIDKTSNGFRVCTGKPSDASCLSWLYDNLEDAQKTAQEYKIKYCNL